MSANVLPFARPGQQAVGPAYDPGVPAFDPMNPAHVTAWNTIVALGRSEQRASTMRAELEPVR